MAAAEKPSFYITTPIYYVNDVPHIGHAYTTLATDAIARFKRLDGFDVRFLTGTDEHGQKVAKTAELQGLDPQSLTDRVSENFRRLGSLLNYSNDDFIRTTEPRHVSSVQALWNRLKDRGQIYLSSYAGWYAVRDEAFYGEDELTVTDDGRRIAPSGAECEWVEEPSYFFRLSDWQQPLLDFYEANPDCILPPGRRNEVVSFVRSGLYDLSISRTTFSWGIPVPDDPDHVMYVWLDALANYLSALGYPETGEGSDFARYWPADVHIVGKDILRFHAVYWPAFLMAAGHEPPRRVFAHGWWTRDGQKMSKSLGNVISPDELVNAYGQDQTRYFLMREVPFGNDGDYSHSAMINRINGDLANDYGNLAQRVLTMVQRYCAGSVPQPDQFTDADRDYLNAIDGLLNEVRGEIDRQALHKALDAIWRVIGMGNRYVDEQQPWALRKTDTQRLGTVLYVLAESLRTFAILTQPFIPTAASRLLDQLSIDAVHRRFEHLGESGRLVPGTALPKPQGLFPRHVDDEGGEPDGGNAGEGARR